MAKEKKIYKYHVVKIAEGSTGGEPTTAMLQKMNELGGGGYRVVTVLEMSSESYVLMEQEGEKVVP